MARFIQKHLHLDACGQVEYDWNTGYFYRELAKCEHRILIKNGDDIIAICKSPKVVCSYHEKRLYTLKKREACCKAME
jgi:hypothetical protein